MTMMMFPKTNTFPRQTVLERSMGPNPCKLCEELLDAADIRAGSVVCDLGSDAGLTSALMAREYGLITYACDLWSEPADNMRFFEEVGLSNRQVIPIKADAAALPFATEFFDAVVCIDSYAYFGRDRAFLDTCLLPFVRHGGLLLLAIPGLRRDCHANPPACLLASWNLEQLEYLHDMGWWKDVFETSGGAELVGMREMACTAEAWQDWIACDNDYARGDAIAIRAGALDHLNTIAVTLRRR